MTNFAEQIFASKQYSLSGTGKTDLLLPELNRLNSFHYENCKEFKGIIDTVYGGVTEYESVESMPFIPVRLFKMFDMKSIPSDQVVRLLKSSGTTSSEFSRIYLDRETAVNQTKALASIVTDFIGPKRLPMIIVDSESSISSASGMSARGAGLVGLSNFGRNHLYLLDENYKVRFDALSEFIEKYSGEPMLIFGFTFMVWQYLYEEFLRRQMKPNISKGILIHAGGWKKLAERAVGNDEFKARIAEQTGIERVHNFYGMVEQVGSVYMECEYGHFHAANFSEILIRNYRDFQPAEQGESGIIQTLSILPKSYPGHSVLTEDTGAILGKDDCPCGRSGTYFKVTGRIPRAELRGCSDVYNR